MTYLEKWFDFNRRQKEIESLLEETIAQQSEQKSDLEREFYLLYYLDLAQRKSLRQIDLPDRNFIWARALFLGWWLSLEAKIAVCLVAGVVIKIGALALSAWQVMGKRHWPLYRKLSKQAWKLVWISWFKMILEKSCVRNHFFLTFSLQGVK